VGAVVMGESAERTGSQPNLIVIFNHALTDDQIEDARRTLAIHEIILPPEAMNRVWSQIPADLEGLDAYLDGVRAWLAASARPGDFVLVQGDFGATYLLVRFSLQSGYIPVYSTTTRQANEQRLPGGEVRMTHDFRHRIFRRYGR